MTLIACEGVDQRRRAGACSRSLTGTATARSTDGVLTLTNGDRRPALPRRLSVGQPSHGPIGRLGRSADGAERRSGGRQCACRCCHLPRRASRRSRRARRAPSGRRPWPLVAAVGATALVAGLGRPPDRRRRSTTTRRGRGRHDRPRWRSAPSRERGSPCAPLPRPSARRSSRSAPTSQQGRSVGTGVIVSADGEILTNAHVVEGATRDPRPAARRDRADRGRARGVRRRQRPRAAADRRRRPAAGHVRPDRGGRAG